MKKVENEKKKKSKKVINWFVWGFLGKLLRCLITLCLFFIIIIIINYKFLKIFAICLEVFGIFVRFVE